MTTTAEKIKAKIADLHSHIDELRRMLDDPQPPDPKPLEFWGNIYNHNNGYMYLHLTEDEAKKKFCGKGRTLKIREVTPQDEQDRKDAARYRYFKSNECLLKQKNSLIGVSADQWDDIADEAMEQE